MQTIDRKVVLRESLLAMRNSLESSYKMRTNVNEESRLLDAWKTDTPDFVVFSDYRRNEGLRRIKDVIEVIDNAITNLNNCDYQTASRVYLETLTSVAFLTKWARVLEKSRNTIE